MRNKFNNAEEMTGHIEEMANLASSFVDEYDVSQVDNLFFEKGVVSSTLQGMEKNGIQCRNSNFKSREKSIEMREKGNKMFATKPHNRVTHLTTLQLYTKSIALAPNNSEELSFAFGNRSALLFHLKNHVECIQDCDRAIKITTSDQLKLKLLHRKTECLIALNDETARNVCNEALHLLEESTSTGSNKDDYEKKLMDASNSISSMTIKETIKKEENISEQLPSFENSNEVPCASEAVAIAHNQTWGRHIVANRNIEPGEILAVEKNYFSFLNPERMYVFCSHCTQSSYTLIPCEHCIYDVYCSEKCKLEAWTKYHQFECSIYPYLDNTESDIRFVFCNLRYILITVHNAGGINKLREELIAVAKCTDLRERGFMDDGVFHSNDSRSVLCIQSREEYGDYYRVSALCSYACYTVYYLATKTTFFGERFDLTPSQMIPQSDMLFFAALLFKNFFSIPYNNLDLYQHSSNFEAVQTGISIHPFSCLFNHSCWPNADHFSTESNERVVYAKHPIEKGSQIFINCCSINFLHEPKEQRQRYLKIKYKFQCKCLPCEEQWSNICLPLIKDLLHSMPESAVEINTLINSVKEIEELNRTKIVYKQDLMKKVVNLLKVIADKVTTYCDEYAYFENVMQKMLVMSFGKKFFEIPDCC